MQALRLVLGLALTLVCLGIAGRRLSFLYRLGRTAQPVEPGRRDRRGAAARAELVEVAGQRKLLKWTVPGLAHFAVFWGFLVLLLTVIEAFGALVNPRFQIPVLGNYAWFGWVEDFFALLCVAAVAVFVGIRIAQPPSGLGRRSRFFGSHLGRGVVHAVHDCQRRVDPAGLPGRRHQRPAGQHDRQHAASCGGRSRRSGSRPGSRRSARRPTRPSRRSCCCCPWLCCSASPSS